MLLMTTMIRRPRLRQERRLWFCNYALAPSTSVRGLIVLALTYRFHAASGVLVQLSAATAFDPYHGGITMDGPARRPQTTGHRT